jgi:hypothetical protein
MLAGIGRAPRDGLLVRTWASYLAALALGAARGSTWLWWAHGLH